MVAMEMKRRDISLFGIAEARWIQRGKLTILMRDINAKIRSCNISYEEVNGTHGLVA